jgi:hypothetical protein
LRQNDDWKDNVMSLLSTGGDSGANTVRILCKERSEALKPARFFHIFLGFAFKFLHACLAAKPQDLVIDFDFDPFLPYVSMTNFTSIIHHRYPLCQLKRSWINELPNIFYYLARGTR